MADMIFLGLRNLSNRSVARGPDANPPARRLAVSLASPILEGTRGGSMSEGRNEAHPRGERVDLSETRKGLDSLVVPAAVPMEAPVALVTDSTQTGDSGSPAKTDVTPPEDFDG